MSFKQTIPLNERITESKRIIEKFSDKIPVIVQVEDKGLILKKNKFLVPYNVNVSYLIAFIRNQIKLESSEAIFLFCDNKMLSGGTIMSTVYNEYKISNNITKNSDQFLYITINKENTFG
jgi:GABA(A) receptor-associated protein